MQIKIEHFPGKFPQFNVSLSSAEGKEPFLVIKGCRIVDGSKGQFVSWPATKKDDGRYWNHVWASEGFAQAVLNAATESQAKPPPRARDDAARARQTRPADDFDDVPF